MSTNQIRRALLLEIKYLGATDTKDPRIKVNCPFWGKSKTFSSSYEFNNGLDQIIDLLQKQGIEILCKECLKDKDYLLIDWYHGQKFWGIA